MQADVLWLPLLLDCSLANSFIDSGFTLEQWIMLCVESEGIYITYAWL